MSSRNARRFYMLLGGPGTPAAPAPYLDDYLTLLGGTQLSWNFSEASGAVFPDGLAGNTGYDLQPAGTPTYQVASGFRGDDYAAGLNAAGYFWDSNVGANLAMSTILAMTEGFVLAMVEVPSSSPYGVIASLTRNVASGRFIYLGADLGSATFALKNQESAAKQFKVVASEALTPGLNLIVVRKRSNKWSMWVNGHERTGAKTGDLTGDTYWFNTMTATVTRMAMGALIRDTVSSIYNGKIARVIFGNTPPDDAMMARFGDALEFAKVWDKWLVNYNGSESDVSYSADSRTVTAVGAPDKVILARQLSKRSGKFYVEYLCHPSAAGITVGAGLWLDTNITDRLGDGESYALYQDGKAYYAGVGTDIGLPDLSGSSSDFVVQMAVDFDAQKIWYGLNGTWSGDPAAGTGQAQSSTQFPTNSPAFACGPQGVGSSVRIRAPDEFSYPVPDGFYAGVPG